jgi:copper(I)-binding protein
MTARTARTGRTALTARPAPGARTHRPGYRSVPSLALAVASLVVLAGCGSADADHPAGATTPAGGPAAESVSVGDAWVKAADSGMSAAFGDLTNTGPQDVTVVSVSSPASTTLELHETVENESGAMVMREKQDGFTIPAGGELLLEPGGNHIMLMDLTAPLVAGDEVTVTLTFSDDSTLDLTAPVKDYAGADESYEGGDGEHEGMEGMEPGDAGADHSEHAEHGEHAEHPGTDDE